MEQAKILKIFLASPSDVRPEREMIFALKQDLDHLIGKPNQIRFEFVNWERSAYPGIGEDAQDVINQNIKEDYSIFIGIFWQRFGTPTNRAESGTEEEYNRAYQKYKAAPTCNHIMMYFKTAAPKNIYELDHEQFQKVRKFKKEIQKQGVLYWEFQNPDDLKTLLLIHISNLVKDKYPLETTKHIESMGSDENPLALTKYELLANKIQEEKSLLATEGIIELVEQTSDGMSQLPQITANISNAVEFIGGKFTEKTNQINAVSKIRDEKIRLRKITVIVNGLAIDLAKYSSDLNELLPEFKETLNNALESYTKLVLMASASSVFLGEVEGQIKTLVPELYRSVDTALDGLAKFLQSLTSLPVLTSKFGTSKRKAELATNEVFKEFISAKKVLNQVML